MVELVSTSLLIKLAKIARSSYYYYLKIQSRPDKYAEVKKEILKIWDSNNGIYGYRRITLELRNKEIIINHKTVVKLMKELGLKCMVRLKKYNSYRGKVGAVADNILMRNFKADKPNNKWVTDVTEFSIYGKKIYLSPILDLFNGEIIAYKISFSPNFNMVKEMLEDAFEKV